MTEIDRLLMLEVLRILKARYCRYLDAKRWQEWGNLFAEDAWLDASEDLESAERDPGMIRGRSRMEGRTEIVRQVRTLLDSAVTVHQVHSPELVILSSTEAEGIWAMEDLVEFSGNSHPFRSLHGYGHYHEHYRYHAGAWQFASVRLTRLHRIVS